MPKILHNSQNETPGIAQGHRDRGRREISLCTLRLLWPLTNTGTITAGGAAMSGISIEGPPRMRVVFRSWGVESLKEHAMRPISHLVVILALLIIMFTDAVTVDAAADGPIQCAV